LVKDSQKGRKSRNINDRRSTGNIIESRRRKSRSKIEETKEGKGTKERSLK